jgi:hypothetical protein
MTERAREISAERGWTWRDPVEIAPALEGGVPVWVLRTNTMARGPSVRISFLRSDLTVVSVGYLPR